MEDNKDQIFQSPSCQTIIEAIEANLRQLYSYFARDPQVSVYDTEKIFRVSSQFPSVFFNTVLGTRLEPAGLEATIEETVRYFKTVQNLLRWLITPLTEPADLPQHLAKWGIQRDKAGDTAGMAVDLSKINGPLTTPANLVIRPVNEPESLQQYVDAFFGSHPDPDPISQIWFNLLAALGLEEDAPLRHYVGLVQNKPVATVSVFYGAGVAGLYFVNTAEEFRGQGIATALTFKALQDAYRRGYQLAILHSSKMGYGVYSRLGFVGYCQIEAYTGPKGP